MISRLISLERRASGTGKMGEGEGEGERGEGEGREGAGCASRGLTARCKAYDKELLNHP